MNSRLVNQDPLDLIRAVCLNDLQRVQIFLTKNADNPEKFTAPGDMGYTALHYAVLNDNPAIINALLVAGANVNVRNDNGDSPLILAASKFKSSALIALSSAVDLDYTCKNKLGYTALSLLTTLIKYKQSIICEFITKKLFDLAGLDNPNDRFLQAAKNGDEIAVKRYIHLNSAESLNVRDIFGCTALSYAVSESRAAIVKLLIDAGADLNTTDKAGMTPLIIATLANNIESVRQLLASPSINLFQTCFVRGQNAYQIALANKYTNIASLIKESAELRGTPIPQEEFSAPVNTVLPDSIPPVSETLHYSAPHWSLFPPTTEVIKNILASLDDPTQSPNLSMT